MLFLIRSSCLDLFSKDEIEEIKRIRLWDILVNTTSIPANAVQRNVFQFTDGSPCPQPSQIRSTMLEPCLIHAGWDYFHGSEIIYVLVTLSLIFVPIGEYQFCLANSRLLVFLSCDIINHLSVTYPKKIYSLSKSDWFDRLRRYQATK